MEPIDPTEKLEYWREHVRKVALFEGAQTEYARQLDSYLVNNGIDGALTLNFELMLHSIL